jgi:hypothetical protein
MSLRTKLLEIGEDDLAGITDEELAECEISRETLHRCFAEGVELMKGYTERDRVRPIAEHTGEGLDDWEVVIVKYSERTDPLMQGKPKGRALRPLFAVRALSLCLLMQFDPRLPGIDPSRQRSLTRPLRSIKFSRR